MRVRSPEYKTGLAEMTGCSAQALLDRGSCSDSPVDSFRDQILRRAILQNLCVTLYTTLWTLIIQRSSACSVLGTRNYSFSVPRLPLR